MADPFQSHQPSMTAPADEHFAIAPADGVDLPVKPRALYVLSAGNVKIRDRKGVMVTYAVTAGQVLDFRAAGIEATGTTATLVGWF